MSIDPKERFSEIAAVYRQHRPSYPAALIDWVLDGVRATARVADLGCGTGISSRAFAVRGCQVTGIDPNEAMLREARAEGGGPRYVRAAAEATGLADASADVVVAAQAFHWFPLEPTLREIARILVPGGRAAAFWNVRADTPLMRDYDAALREFIPRYESRPQRGAVVEAIRAGVPPLVREPEEAELAHIQRLDAPGLRGRAHSSSYVVHDLPPGRRAAFDAALDAIFARHARGGAVEFAYRTVAIRWRCRG